MIKISKFKTEDEKEFDTEEEALVHEQALVFAGWLEEHPELYFNSLDNASGPMRIAKAILEAYDLKLKTKKTK